MNVARRTSPTPPPGYGCEHAGCAAWGSVRHYLPRWQAKPEPGPLYCVAHAKEHAPKRDAAPTAPPTLSAPAGRQGSLL